MCASAPTGGHKNMRRNEKSYPITNGAFVLGLSLLGQAQGRLLLRIDHEETALEIGYTKPGNCSKDDFCIALFSKQLGKFATKRWCHDEVKSVTNKKPKIRGRVFILGVFRGESLEPPMSSEEHFLRHLSGTAADGSNRVE